MRVSTATFPRTCRRMNAIAEPLPPAKHILRSSLATRLPAAARVAVVLNKISNLNLLFRRATLRRSTVAE
jgi:hypothetical protein